MLLSILPSLLIAVTSVVAAPADIWKPPPPSVDLESVDEAIGDGPAAQLFKKFQPSLQIDRANCCNSYPAVGEMGTLNKGMKPDGSVELCQRIDPNKCSNSNPEKCGQVYVRGFQPAENPEFDNHYAIMYAWYFPKIQNHPHSRTHDWQQVIVWLVWDEQAKDFKTTGFSLSGPNGYKTVAPDRKFVNLDKKSPGHAFFVYTEVDGGRGIKSDFPKQSPSLIFQPMVAYDVFTTSAKKSIENKDAFGKGFAAPFANVAYKGHLQAAWDARLKK